MCGRYALALSNEEVYESLQNQLPQLFGGHRTGNNGNGTGNNNGNGANRPRWERQQDYRPKSVSHLIRQPRRAWRTVVNIWLIILQL